MDPPWIQSTNSSNKFAYDSDNVPYKPYILSKVKSQHEGKNVEDNEEDMTLEIDDLPSQSLWAFWKMGEKPS